MPRLMCSYLVGRGKKQLHPVVLTASTISLHLAHFLRTTRGFPCQLDARRASSQSGGSDDVTRTSSQALAPTAVATSRRSTGPCGGLYMRRSASRDWRKCNEQPSPSSPAHFPSPSHPYICCHPPKFLCFRPGGGGVLGYMHSEQRSRNYFSFCPQK